MEGSSMAGASGVLALSGEPKLQLAGQEGEELLHLPAAGRWPRAASQR